MSDLEEQECLSDIPSSTNAVNIQTDAASSLADHSTVLEGVINALNGVVLHTDKEA